MDSRLKRFCRGLFYALSVLLIANLDPIYEKLALSRESYFTEKHLIVGGITGAIMAVLFYMIHAANLAKKGQLEDINRMLERKVEGRTRELVERIEESGRIEKASRENESFLNTIIETEPECVKLVARDGSLIRMNRAGLSMMDADSLEQVRGKSIFGLVLPEYREAFRQLVEDVFDGKSGTLEFEMRGLRGRSLWMDTHSVPLRDEKGGIIALLGITRDITVQKAAKAAFEESQERYRSLVDSTEDSIYLVDRDCRYLFMNSRHLSRMGLSTEDCIGRSYGEFHSLQETGEFTLSIENVFASGLSHQHEHKSGRDGRYFLRTLSPVKDEAGRTFAVTVVSKDINERKRMEEELRALSLMDELTGLYNRRGFMTLASQHIKIANRIKKGIFILYADLDGLKKINDTLGHAEGDNAIMEAAQILKDTFRDSDIISRIGGDEFVLLPIEIGSNASAEFLIARLQKKLDERNAKRNSGYRLSISTGIAYYDPESGSTLNDILSDADRMMYEQKKSRRKTA
ncbi:MAG: diguanylate cyclase [Nitrospiraceae bacterium]|nr:diguanylate cyclase [Nitrospiraceae bacterium]